MQQGSTGRQSPKHRPLILHPDILVVSTFVVAVTIFFAPALFSGGVLLPADNLYRGEPWRSAAPATELVPHNDLIGDQIFQNYPWKLFARQEIAERQIPLWNPYIFAGMPFLAAGQYGVLYPLGAIFYLIPVATAYAWYAALHLLIAAIGTYLLLRALGAGRFGGTVAALSYAFCGFLVASLIWPQVIGATAWLPWLVFLGELLVRRAEREEKGSIPSSSRHEGGDFWIGARRTFSPAPLAALIAVLVGLVLLAGHFEISFYVLFVVGWYALLRLAGIAWRQRRFGPSLRCAIWLGIGAAVGIVIAGAQLLPFLELAPHNFRQGSATYAEVVEFALPIRHLAALLMPDFFGNPTHHQFFDLFGLRVVPVPNNSLGQATDPPHTIFWGIKNYVEGAGYVGVVTLLLAVVALWPRGVRSTRFVAIFAALGLWSFLLAFGTPLYRLFFILPFFDQLHTPFRWLLPASFALAVLAGLGAGRLSNTTAISNELGHGSAIGSDTGVGDDASPTHLPTNPSANDRYPKRSGQRIGIEPRFPSQWLLVASGGLLLVAIVVTHFRPELAVRVASALFRQEARLPVAFASPEMFVSYEARNIALLALALLGLGAVLWLRRIGTRPAIWQALAVMLVFAELYAVGAGFNTVADTQLATFQPSAVQFLQAQPGPFRIVGFGASDVLRPNTAMLVGIEDVRGYDSVIPRQYADYWALIEPTDALQYNQIANLRRPESLGSTLLDLLNVRYVVTIEHLDRPDLRLLYDREIRIYERPSVLPRAFFVPNAVLASDATEARRIVAGADFDPRSTVVVEPAAGQPEPKVSRGAGPGAAFVAAEVLARSADRVTVRVDAPGDGYVIVLDSYFPGVQAQVDGVEGPVYRANANFRAVPVEPGAHTVEVRYNPMSFKLGLFLSFLGLVIAALLVSQPFWARLIVADDRTASSSVLARVGQNSLFPMGTSLLNKVVDLAFAMLVLRLLGPENVGKYAFAAIFIGYFEILTNFGLNALLIREVARDRSEGPRYLGTSMVLRLALCLGSLPLALAMLQFWRVRFNLAEDAALAILLLGVALIPGNIAAAYSSLYYAHERNVVPAAVTVVTTLIRVGLGGAVLLLGAGFLGLAAVAVFGNIVTAVLLVGLARRTLDRPRIEIQPKLARYMLVASYPLMLNHLLATLFFKIDVLLLQAMQGDAAVGYYNTAYKLIDGLLIIPSSFTFAIFPLISRYAAHEPDALRRAFVTSVRLLIAIALPLAVGVTVLATPFIDILGGAEYLPGSATALQILIWFLPFSFVNGVTQYVLIAINQQRFITGSFIVATIVNIVANLILIPSHGYLGAGFATVLAEIVLIVPFLGCIWRHMGKTNLLPLLPRPVLAATVMGGLMLATATIAPPLVVFVVGLVSYPPLVLLLRAFPDDEVALARRALGARLGRLRRSRRAVSGTAKLF